MTCLQCSENFRSKLDLTKHIEDAHKSYKPCDYFAENKCELDDCKYNHVKLKPGQEICCKCDLFYKYKGELRKHIIAMHGNILCHKFLKNSWTQQRCFFSHNTMTAINAAKTPEPNKTHGKTPEDFPNLPTIRPVMGGQVAAVEAETQPQTRPNLPARIQDQNLVLETQVLEALTKMIPILTHQLVAVLQTKNNQN